jgi:hypothetical protein
MSTDVHLSESVIISAHQWLKGLEQNRRKHERSGSISTSAVQDAAAKETDDRMYRIYRMNSVLGRGAVLCGARAWKFPDSR